MGDERSIRDEIADAIFDACEGYYAMGGETAKGVAQTLLASPVIRRIQAEAWDRCVGEMPIDPDWKNFYGDNNPYIERGETA